MISRNEARESSGARGRGCREVSEAYGAAGWGQDGVLVMLSEVEEGEGGRGTEQRSFSRGDLSGTCKWLGATQKSATEGGSNKTRQRGDKTRLCLDFSRETQCWPPISSRLRSQTQHTSTH